MTGDVEMRDFSKKREPIRFRINGAELTAKPAIGMATVQRVIRLNEEMAQASGSEKLARLSDLFGMLLHSKSKDAFDAVLADEDDPVDADQLLEMLNFVMEKQGLRPTVPSSASSESPDDGKPGTPGADGVSPVA